MPRQSGTTDASPAARRPRKELALLRAFLYAPDSLTVLDLACTAITLSAPPGRSAGRGLPRHAPGQPRLGISDDWRRLDEHGLGGRRAPFGLLRFYLLALKAAGVVLLRLGDIDNARDHLEQLAALDQRDQLGASALLDIIDPVPDVSAA